MPVSVPAAILGPDGLPLRGNDPSSPAFGRAHEAGAWVEILAADGGVFPPDAQGEPQAANPVLYTTRIGLGVSPTAANAGRFGALVAPRPSALRLVVRVFDAPSKERAAFYGDSQVFTVNAVDAFMAVVSPVALPLDSGDDDGDGLNNSWEKRLGSNPLVRDSDEDGVGDNDEFRAGTDPAYALSNLSQAQVSLMDGQPRVQWASVSNRSYQVEAAADCADYVPVSPVVTATGATTSVSLADLPVPALNCFRIRLVEP